MRQIVLDTETTGLDPSKGHRLTEIGCIEIIDRKETGRRFQTYLNPEREIDPGAQQITGLTTAFLADKPLFKEVAQDFWAFLQPQDSEIIIHNAPFDLGFLNAEFALIEHPFLPIEQFFSILDTLVLARQLHPGQRNSLDVLCKRYNVDNSERDYHGALLDARLLLEVYLAMTAGQTAMALGTDSPLSVNSSKIRQTKVKRKGDFPLKIIQASEAELEAHLAILAKLKEKT